MLFTTYLLHLRELNTILKVLYRFLFFPRIAIVAIFRNYIQIRDMALYCSADETNVALQELDIINSPVRRVSTQTI